MTDTLLAQSPEQLELVRRIRRELHRFPEIGTELPRTRAQAQRA